MDAFNCAKLISIYTKNKISETEAHTNTIIQTNSHTHTTINKKIFLNLIGSKGEKKIQE